jgi:hypothetical protein
MKRDLEMVRKFINEPRCRRYDAVHFATGIMKVNKEEYGNKKIYSAADVLQLLELVATDPERSVEDGQDH